MSSIKLESNASGTGIFTLASPATNTNRTLTLPDATGTIITTAGGAAISGTTGSFSGDLSFNSGYGSAAVAYGCRAWVNFNGGGTINIVGSGNVSSITDFGVGAYRANFTIAMPDANYIAVPASGRDQASDTGNVVAYVNTTGSVDISTFSEGTSTRQDVSVVGVAVFR